MNFKPVFEIFTFINMKYIDFLKHVREYENYDMCLESINKNYGRNNEKVSLEALLKMSVLCKTISGIENYKLLIYKRSGSNGFEIYKTSIKKILFEKINNGSKSGKVDIIIFNEKKEFVLISSKLFDNKIVKNFKDYDIDDNFIATKNELIKRGFCDTDKFCGIITNCFKKNLLKFTNRNGENNSINEKSLDDKFLFGLEEINKMYENLRLYLLNINDENLLEKIEKTNNFQKKRLYLKFHQRYISNLLQQKIENNKSKYYLLGCAPRVGKSYIMADIILKNDFRNVLIISRLKTNLKEGFEELYDEYCNFEENNYNTYLYNYETSDLNLDNKNIVVDTLQSVQKDTSLYNKFDVVFYDESHIGSGAEFLRDDLEHYINDTGITIFVSATFKKTKDKFDISLNDCVFFGDYEISQLKTKDKNLLDKMKNTGITDDEIENFHYPTINIYNFDLVDKFRKKILTETKQDNSSINYTSLFAVYENGEFKNYIDVFNILEEIFISNTNSRRKTGIINNISETDNIKRTLKSVLTFLPSIEAVVAVEKIIKEHFDKNYSAIAFHSPKENVAKRNINNPVKQIKEKLLKEPQKTLIILSCSMLETGITIKSCDGVILLDDTTSEDVIYQRICRTCSNINKHVFVLDGNPNRILHSVVKYVFFDKHFEQEKIKKYFMKMINSFYNFFDDNFELQNNSILENIGKIYYEQNLKNYNISECCKSINSYDNIEIDNTLKLSKKKLQIEMKQFMEKTKTFNKITNPEYNNDGEIKDDKNEDVQNEIIKLLLFREALVYAYIRITMFMVGNSLIDKIKNIDDEIFVDIQNKIITLYGIKITRELLLNKYFNLSCDDSMIILCNHIINEMKNGDLISIYDIIEKFLKPNELQKKKNGEVFTPLELIREKCSKVPEEFWRDKNVKVLDPCCGIGNYQVVLIEFFMKGLVEEIPDEKERLYWIKTKILYCTDICSLNVALCKKITGVENVYCVDFLSCSFLDEMKFDMVIGNPPYQAVSKNLKAVGGRGLWEKFVLQSLEILKENGYLCFVHPQGWRRPESKIGSFMKTHEFVYLQTNTNPFIGIGVTVDYYVLKKNNNGQYTKMPFIPHDLSEISLNIINKILKCEEKFVINITSKYGTNSKFTSKNKNEEYIYPIYHTKNQIIYSKNKSDYFIKSKIIVSDTGEFYPFYDSGEYGTSQDSMYYLTNKEKSKKILSILNSKLIKWFLKNNKVGNFRNDWKLISYIPVIDINLTNEEIKFIEENVKIENIF